MKSVTKLKKQTWLIETKNIFDRVINNRDFIHEYKRAAGHQKCRWRWLIIKVDGKWLKDLARCDLGAKFKHTEPKTVYRKTITQPEETP